MKKYLDLTFFFPFFFSEAFEQTKKKCTAKKSKLFFVQQPEIFFLFMRANQQKVNNRQN